MKTKIHIIALVLFFNISNVLAQDISGLWEIKKVLVGGQTMTPVAKWTNIHKNGTYQSGNGWLQNAEGTWTFDKSKKLYSPVETNGIKDEFGPFTIELNNDTMTWLREEEGMIVTVTLEKIDRIPKGSADQIVGLWDLQDVLKNDESIKTIIDPDSKHYIFIRWDRLYVERTPKGNRSTGYWHINGHKPEITLLSHDKKKAPQSWKITMTANMLKMMGISDSNKGVEMVYKRIHQFPK